MSGRDELQAAYFALLRAREELEALQRYEEYLHAERERLTAFLAAGEALDERIDRRLRRGLSHTDDELTRAVRRRTGAVVDELSHLPARLEAASTYVAEAEREHDRLRRSA